MGFADLHIHSVYSYDGTTSVSAILKYTADFTDLDVIAITDHNSMIGVQEALDLAPRYNLEVVPGVEISTLDGHLLALFIDRPIVAGLSLLETVLKVGELGGICIAAHPMAQGVNSLSFKSIWSVLNHPDAAKILIGVEAFNGGLVYTRRNKIVTEECEKLPLALLGNSDAHILPLIGQGATMFDGNTGLDLRYALENKITIPLHGKGLNGVAVLTSYLPRFLLRKLGWVSWNANPESSIKFARCSQVLTARSMP